MLTFSTFLVSFLLAALSCVYACSVSNIKCMDDAARRYTNAVRARRGLGALMPGSSSMRNNAFQHSRHMASRGSLYHQNMGVSVWCNSLSAENVAMNFARDGNDAAKKCVDQWEKSPSHYANIVSNNRYVSIGIYYSNGKVWCTQTFSSRGCGGSGGSGGGGGTSGARSRRRKSAKRRSTTTKTQSHSHHHSSNSRHYRTHHWPRYHYYRYHRH